jgi:hypothetical protein
MRTRVAALLAVPALAFAALALGAPSASAARRGSVTASWAPAESAAIRPGVQTNTEAGQCTANFVFTDGTDVLLGQAAHCSGQGAATATNGCDQDSAPLPIGSRVEITGFDGKTYVGSLVYSSWNTMLANGEQNDDTCENNDFALVKLSTADAAKVNPSVPFWGGPAATNTAGTEVGDDVFTYGNSSLRLGFAALSPKSGVSLGTSAGGWTHTIYTATQGIPGDSGSAVLDSAGKALGVLVTVAAAPIPLSNGVSDLNHLVTYAKTHSGLTGLTLANGTNGFDRHDSLGVPVPLG